MTRTAGIWNFPKQATKQALTAADIMARIAEEESWLEHYRSIGVDFSTQEAKVYDLREQLRKQLRKMRGGQ